MSKSHKLASFAKGVVAAALMSAASLASAAIVYVGDAAGHVGKFDTTTSTGVPLGSVSVGQAIGLAYNGATGTVYVLDRNTNKVFGMDGTTGAASLAFNSSSGFQGGAISGGLLYGTFEGGSGTPAGAYNLAGAQTVTGSAMPAHTHAMGVDPATGQLYTIGSDNVIRGVSSAGVAGAGLVTAAIAEFADDLDYFGGNFLVAQFSNARVDLVNGITGAVSPFITAAQIREMGLGSVSGVVVQFAGTTVPEPGTLVLLAAAGLGMLTTRRKAQK